MKEFFQIAGQVAGLGGISLVVFLAISKAIVTKTRDVNQDSFEAWLAAYSGKAIVAKTRDVNQGQSYKLLNLLLILAAVITVLGIVSWLISLAISGETSVRLRLLDVEAARRRGGHQDRTGTNSQDDDGERKKLRSILVEGRTATHRDGLIVIGQTNYSGVVPRASPRERLEAFAKLYELGERNFAGVLLQDVSFAQKYKMFDEIVEADFSNASFLRAIFAEVSFKDVNFTEADLRFTEIRPDVDPPQFRRCRVDGALVSSRSNLPHIGRNIPETALSEIRTTRGERVPFLFVLRWDKPTAYDMDRSN